MILGLAIGILGTSLVWALVLGLASAARLRDEEEAARYAELPQFEPEKPSELLVADLGFDAWVNGDGDAA